MPIRNIIILARLIQQGILKAWGEDAITGCPYMKENRKIVFKTATVEQSMSTVDITRVSTDMA